MFTSSTKKVSTHRTGTLRVTGMTKAEAVRFVQNKLGVKAQCISADESDGKVSVQWRVENEFGAFISIWDYCGGLKFGQLSTYGSHEIFRDLFGDKYTEGNVSFRETM